MNPFEELSNDNHDQIRKYLRFFRQKKDGILREIDREFVDIRNDKLEETMFTKDDMLEYSDYLQSAIKSHVASDIGAIINMGALAVNQLLSSSQDKGVELTLETAPLENQALIDAIEKMSLDSMPKNAKRGTQLASFRDEAKAIRDEQGRLEDTNARLQAEVNNLRQRLAQLDRSAASAAESKSADDSNTRNQLRSLERSLEEAKEENNKRINETTQFQQMRKMMQSQSAKIRDLRRRLERYEPDACKEDDGDDF